MGDVTLNKELKVKEIKIMEDDIVAVTMVTKLKEKTGRRKEVGRREAQHLLRPAMGGNPQDDISGEHLKVQAICNAIW